METRVIEYSRVSNNRTASISGKLCFILLAKKGQFDVVEVITEFNINLNAQHVNGMTHFDFELLYG